MDGMAGRDRNARAFGLAVTGGGASSSCTRHRAVQPHRNQGHRVSPVRRPCRREARVGLRIGFAGGNFWRFGGAGAAGGTGGGGAVVTFSAETRRSTSGPSWSKLCLHFAQRTVRPSIPMALSGTTWRVAQAGQAIIMVTRGLRLPGEHDKRQPCSQTPETLFHMQARL